MADEILTIREVAHTATGSAEHLRRLLYNGITRAQNHCTVIVLGQNRLNAPPFAP